MRFIRASCDASEQSSHIRNKSNNPHYPEKTVMERAGPLTPVHSLSNGAALLGPIMSKASDTLMLGMLGTFCRELTSILQTTEAAQTRKATKLTQTREG